MKQHQVYRFSLLILLFCGLVFSGCGRKSGCAAIQTTVQPRLGKDGKPKGKATTELFGKKTRRKMRN